jgi:uncharacterized protein with HEPN domain
VRSDHELLEDLLEDLLEALTHIERYACRGRAAFDADELIRTWVVHHLQIVGQACRGLSAEFVRRHPQIPWTKIIGMRNILVHHYFGIDPDAVWHVVEHELPDLRRALEAIVAQELPPPSAAGPDA